MTPSKHLVNIILLLGFAVFLMFAGLGSMGLTDRDEGRNAEAGREMFETGNWVSPTFNYEPRFAKPVFVYWLMSLSYQTFGVSEWTARFPSAVFGVGLILIQYLFLARLRGPTIGFWGAMMLLFNIEIIGLSRMALTDAVLMFFTTASLFGFWLGLNGTGSQRHWHWLFYVGMALGTLTKGPVGFLVPMVTVALYLTISSRWRLYWETGFPILGTIVLTGMAVPWYVVMWTIHGQEYLTIAQAHTVGRFLSPMEGHNFTYFFYIPVLLLGFFPWSGWLPFAWMEAYRNWRETKRHGASVSHPVDQELEWFAAAWVLGVFVFFTLSSTRLPHYIGPLFPGAAILTACFWSRGLEDSATRGVRASIHTVMAIGYLLAIGFASLPSLYPSIAGKLTKEFPLATQMNLGSGPYVASILLLIGMALVGYFGLSDSKRAGAFWAACASLGLLVMTLLVLVIPGLNRYFISPPQVLAYAAGVNLGANDRLIAFGSTRPSLAFYARRRVEFIPSGEIDRLRQTLLHEGRTMIILPESVLSALPKETESYQPILKRHGYLLLANEPMVEIPEGAGPPASTDRPLSPH